MEEAGKQNLSIKQWTLVNLYGMFSSSMGYSAVLAVSMMPIGDLIVITYSAPVFSVILDALILKRPLTILTVILCISIGSIKYHEI